MNMLIPNSILLGFAIVILVITIIATIRDGRWK